jgi:hypothetical protein
MDKDYFNILIFGHTTFWTKRLRIREETFKILIYLLAFAQFSAMFFLCDYIQLKKKTFPLDQLRLELQAQQSQIRSFSASIEALEKRIIRLKDSDRRIHTIANLDRSREVTPFIGIGGSPSPVTHRKLEEETP